MRNYGHPSSNRSTQTRITGFGVTSTQFQGGDDTDTGIGFDKGRERGQRRRDNRAKDRNRFDRLDRDDRWSD